MRIAAGARQVDDGSVVFAMTNMFPRHLNEAGDVLPGDHPFAAFPGMKDAAHDDVQRLLRMPQEIVQGRQLDGQIIAPVDAGSVLLQECQPL